jgi:hypothetical protein
MAKPRIFVSSTYYDLKHVRASLDLFIESLGYDSILSEKGDIPYSPDSPLDESCYREVETVDILVLIIGGRYGSEASGTAKKLSKDFFDRYESITKKEFETAIQKDIPVYILIESNVYAEYRTYLRNKDNKTIKYAHVDSVNVFNFIEEILSKPRNNPIQPFDKFEQIEKWLKEQWAGQYRELLNKRSQQNQIRTLSAEISGLQEVNKTLKTYLEAVLSTIKPEESSHLIESEKKRLEDVSVRIALEENPWITHCISRYNLSFDNVVDLIIKSKSFGNFCVQLPSDEIIKDAINILNDIPSARRDFNDARKILGLKIFSDARIISRKNI